MINPYPGLLALVLVGLVVVVHTLEVGYVGFETVLFAVIFLFAQKNGPSRNGP